MTAMKLPELLSWTVDGEAVEPAVAQQRQQRLAELRRDHVTRPTIFVGAGTCGLGAGAKETLAAVHQYLDGHEIKADVVMVGCIGLCSVEPLVDVQLPGRTRVCYKHITADKVSTLLDWALAGSVPDDLVLGQHRHSTLQAWPDVPFLDEHPFFAPQTRWVLANCGLIDPSQIEEYIARGGYSSLVKTLRGVSPDDLCDMVEKSGLRGRGGGGFPTGKKWKFARAAKGDQKYLICNADEGDPGAFMDRAVIESDPHRLLEGMALAAYGIGATKAYVYIRAEYPLAIKRLKAAIAQAEANQLLGHDILGTDFHLNIIIKMGAGAFVCGEETALIHSIEGKRGMPRPRPPFPAISGLFASPRSSTMLRRWPTCRPSRRSAPTSSARWERRRARARRCLRCRARSRAPGWSRWRWERPSARSSSTSAAAFPTARSTRPCRSAAPSGGCIPTQHLDIDVDYESLKTVGAIMGSGGLVVMDEDTCMVDVAKFFMDFIQRESCGKCIPCREGTRRMLEILQRITRGRKRERGIDALERFKSVLHLQSLAETIRDTSLCGLGQTAPNPVLSTLRWFRDEYESHIYERKCPAAACSELVTYSIDAEKCKGCTVCAKKCPAGAIVGAAKSPHHIVLDKCIGCGCCVDACRFDAVVKQ